MPPLPDLSPLLQLALTALAVLAGAALLLRTAASRYFFVDAPFAPSDPYRAARMSIGDPAAPAPGVCAVCGAAASKRCGRCKSVRYCSSACQSIHWDAHKLNCKQEILPVKADISSSDSGAHRRRKFPGFSSISLVPACGTCKVLQEPKKILFPYEEFVKLFNWDKPGFLPCGLLNCGNSCFANVVLQCLASTRPLVAYLLERDHSRGCIRKRDDWCFLCELQVHIQRASESSHPFSPINILSRLPNIGGNLGNGRQEDAHEFMRFAIDTMQSVCLDEFGGEKALDFSTQETTLIQYIFGGYLQSQVICTKCNMISNRYENMMDLTVEIQGDVDSLEECLDQFTVKEWLDGENMYKCEGCNDYVKAWKRLTVHQAPNILTIALKRFQSGRFGKLNKRVSFPENLDLSPYMSGNGDGTDLYSLYAVVVHVDMLNASFFGHYICYTKDYHGHWYRIDDCKVMHVEVEEVLAQGAYMLLYSRRTARSEPFIKPMEPSKKHISEVAPKPTNIVDADSLSSSVGLQSNIPPSGGPSEVYLHRDIGHERNLLVGSNIIKEGKSDYMDLDISTEIEPMPVSGDLGDMDMNDSDPSMSGPKHLAGKSSISPCVPEDVTFVEPARSNPICPAENSSIEVKAMDREELGLSSNSDNCMEHKTRSNSVSGEVRSTKRTPEDSVSGGNIIHSVADASSASIVSSSSEPGISSDGDNCVEQNPIQNLTAEKASKSLTYTPDLLSRQNNVPNMTEISSSASITTTSTMLEPLDDPSPNLETLAVACDPLSSANKVHRRDDIYCENIGTQNLTSCWVKDSGGKSNVKIDMRKESAGDGERTLHASKVNGYTSEHVKIDFPEPSLCHNDASLEPFSVNSNNILSAPEPEPSISSDGDNCVEQNPIQNLTAEKASKSLTYTPDLLSRENNVPNMTEISSGASITTTSTMLEPLDDPSPNLEPLAVACDPLSSANKVHRRDDIYCENIGTQNLTSCRVKDSGGKSNVKIDMRKESAGDGEGTLHASQVNGYTSEHVKIDFPQPSLCHNDASLEPFSVNGKNILSAPALSLISSSSQNRSCNQVMDAGKNINTQLGGTGRPCKTNCDGSAELDSSQKNVSSDDISVQFLSANDKSGKIELASSGRACHEGSSEPDFTEQTNNESSIEPFPSNEKDVIPESSLSFMAPDFLNKFYQKSASEDGIAKKKLDRRYKTSFNGSAGLQASEQRLRDNDAGRAYCDVFSGPDFTAQTLTDNESSLFSSNGEDNLPESGLSFMAPNFLNKFYNKLTKEDGIARKKYDHQCKNKSNGFARLQAAEQRIRDNAVGMELHSGNDKSTCSGSGFSSLSRGFLSKSYKNPIKGDEIVEKELESTHHPYKTKERASVCQDGSRGYRPDSNVVEFFDKGPEKVAFTNGNNVRPIDKNAADMSS